MPGHISVTFQYRYQMYPGTLVTMSLDELCKPFTNTKRIPAATYDQESANLTGHRVSQSDLFFFQSGDSTSNWRFLLRHLDSQNMDKSHIFPHGRHIPTTRAHLCSQENVASPGLLSSTDATTNALGWVQTGTLKELPFQKHYLNESSWVTLHQIL